MTPDGAESERSEHSTKVHVVWTRVDLIGAEIDAAAELADKPAEPLTPEQRRATFRIVPPDTS